MCEMSSPLEVTLLLPNFLLPMIYEAFREGSRKQQRSFNESASFGWFFGASYMISVRHDGQPSMKHFRLSFSGHKWSCTTTAHTHTHKTIRFRDS